jgi:2-octaprenyl-6-methoxyphenol hydroxylase
MAILRVEVCIVGAGPVGATLACRLAAAGVPTALIDRAPLPPMEHPDFDGRAYALAAGIRPLLDDAGLWRRLPEPPCPIAEIRVTDGRIGQKASPLFLHFDQDTLGAGPFGWMTEARHLRLALNARLHDLPGLALFAPATATIAFPPPAAPHAGGDAVRVQVADGPTIEAQLVVAAEGRESPLRRQAGIPVTRWPYRQSAIVCAVAHEKPHHNVALEHFLPQGPFAQLPMGPTEDAADVSALVWTDRPDRVARLMALPEAPFAAELARRLGDHLGILRPIGRRWSYPLSALFAQRFTAPRLALVGDAAHGIHPIAGQGLNLGFRDVMALANLIIHAEGDVGSPALLAAYQRQRRPDTLLMLAATDALDRLFSSDLPPLRLARDLGLAAVQRLPPLKRFFTRRAMGIAGVPG